MARTSKGKGRRDSGASRPSRLAAAGRPELEPQDVIRASASRSAVELYFAARDGSPLTSRQERLLRH